MVKKFEKFSTPQLDVVEHRQEPAVVLTNEAKLSLYKKSQKSGIAINILEEVFHRGYSIWNNSFGGTPDQFAFDRVNSFISGGFALQLDEDLISELSPQLVGKVNKTRTLDHRPSKTATAAATLSKAVKKKQLDPKCKVGRLPEDTAEDRLVGSDSLVKKFKSVTPGQNTLALIKRILKDKP